MTVIAHSWQHPISRDLSVDFRFRPNGNLSLRGGYARSISCLNGSGFEIDGGTKRPKKENIMSLAGIGKTMTCIAGRTVVTPLIFYFSGQLDNLKHAHLCRVDAPPRPVLLNRGSKDKLPKGLTFTPVLLTRVPPHIVRSWQPFLGRVIRETLSNLPVIGPPRVTWKCRSGHESCWDSCTGTVPS